MQKNIWENLTLLKIQFCQVDNATQHTCENAQLVANERNCENYTKEKDALKNGWAMVYFVSLPLLLVEIFSK